MPTESKSRGHEGNLEEQQDHIRYEHCHSGLGDPGGVFMDLAHLPYVVRDVRAIGYPTYILYIVGIWKVLAVAALLCDSLDSENGPRQSHF